MTYRVEQVFLACCLSGVGLAIAALRLLADPGSRLSRFVDRRVQEVGPR